jgi:hypothetical protein
MTRDQLLNRKVKLEAQIKNIEQRIVQEKEKDRERVLFDMLNSVQKSLDGVKKQLGL